MHDSSDTTKMYAICESLCESTKQLKSDKHCGEGSAHFCLTSEVKQTRYTINQAQERLLSIAVCHKEGSLRISYSVWASDRMVMRIGLEASSLG